MSQVKKKQKNLWNVHPQRDAMKNYQSGDALHTGPPRTKRTPGMVGNVVWTPQYPQHHLTGIKLRSPMGDHATKARGGSVITSLVDGFRQKNLTVIVS